MVAEPGLKQLSVAAWIVLCAGCDPAPGAPDPSASPAGPTITSPASQRSAAPAAASASVSASATTPAAQDTSCTFDWVDLGEAYRACPVLGDSSTPWVPIVRTIPKELTVPSGGSLRFTVALGGGDGRGPWTAELNDRCGVALRPLLLDAREQPLEHVDAALPPVCPAGRARVTLSTRARSRRRCR